jgi:hypothetical protein
VICLAGRLSQRHLQAIDYLREENRGSLHRIFEVRVFDSVDTSIHERLETLSANERPPTVVAIRRFDNLAVLADNIEQVVIAVRTDHQLVGIVLVGNQT